MGRKTFKESQKIKSSLELLMVHGKEADVVIAFSIEKSSSLPML